MPLDPVMARGIAPLGAGLADTMYQIAQLKRQDANTAEFQRRTDLYEQNAQREALSAEKQAELRREYRNVVQYVDAPEEIQEAFIEQLRQRDPEFANSPLAKLPAKEALPRMRAGMEAMLGERQQAAEAPLTVKESAGPFGSRLLVGGNRFEVVEPPRPNAGPAPVQPPASIAEWQAFQQMSPADQQRYLQMKRANATPEIAGLTTAATETAKKNVATSTAVEKKINDAANVEDALDLATPLIHVATGSGVGAAVDAGARLFGVTLDGDAAIAGLKVLEAKIVLSMPRMEGPQSDRDALLYREAAGQIGDPTVPREKKQAAVRTIRNLNARYKATNAAAAPAATGGQRLRFDEQGNPLP